MTMMTYSVLISLQENATGPSCVSGGKRRTTEKQRAEWMRSLAYEGKRHESLYFDIVVLTLFKDAVLNRNVI